jgi:hypothetical protein
VKALRVVDPGGRSYAALMRAALFLLPILALPACSSPRTGPAAAAPVAQSWRSVASEADRKRLRDWRNAWLQALAKARTGGHAAEVAAEGALLDPDAALQSAAPAPVGEYRCRTLKLGAKQPGLLDYVAYPAFDCSIVAEEGGLAFVKRSGSQRPIGRLYPESSRRMVFLGTLQLGDEQGALRYGHDEARDMAGMLEQIGERRWRLVFPFPHFESTLDVLELVPAR